MSSLQNLSEIQYFCTEVMQVYRCLVQSVSHTYLQEANHLFLQEPWLPLPNIPGPDSRGGGHKSHPLRDYTLLKAHDPGWMESRAVEGATGKTPACLE